MMEFTTDHQSGPENTDYQRSSHACPEYSDFFSVIALALLLLEIEGPWWLTDFFTLSISYFRFFSLFDTATALEQLKGQPIREGLSWHARLARPQLLKLLLCSSGLSQIRTEEQHKKGRQALAIFWNCILAEKSCWSEFGLLLPSFSLFKSGIGKSRTKAMRGWKLNCNIGFYTKSKIVLLYSVL